MIKLFNISFLFLFHFAFSQKVVVGFTYKSIHNSRYSKTLDVSKNFAFNTFILKNDSSKNRLSFYRGIGIEFEHLQFKTEYYIPTNTMIDNNKYSHQVFNLNLFATTGLKIKLLSLKKSNYLYTIIGINPKLYFLSKARINFQGTNIKTEGFRLTPYEYIKLTDFFSIGIKLKKTEIQLSTENIIFNKFWNGFFYKNDDKIYNYQFINLTLIL